MLQMRDSAIRFLLLLFIPFFRIQHPWQNKITRVRILTPTPRATNLSQNTHKWGKYPSKGSTMIWSPFYCVCTDHVFTVRVRFFWIDDYFRVSRIGEPTVFIARIGKWVSARPVFGHRSFFRSLYPSAFQGYIAAWKGNALVWWIGPSSGHRIKSVANTGKISKCVCVSLPFRILASTGAVFKQNNHS